MTANSTPESHDAVLDTIRTLLEVVEAHGIADRLAAAHARELAEQQATIEALRETNRRLNRRVQMGEAAVPSYQKLIAIPPDGDGVRLAGGNFGRALLTWYCEQLTARAEAAEARADAAMGLLRECLPYVRSWAQNKAGGVHYEQAAPVFALAEKAQQALAGGERKDG